MDARLGKFMVPVRASSTARETTISVGRPDGAGGRRGLRGPWEVRVSCPFREIGPIDAHRSGEERLPNNQLPQRALGVRTEVPPVRAQTVAFLSDVTGVPQVWQVDVDGGWPRQLTFFDERVSKFRWSPSGDRLSFSMDRGGDERDQLYALDSLTGVVDSLAVDPEVMHGLGAWSPSGDSVAYTSNARNSTYFDVYIHVLSSGESRLMWQDDGSNSVAGFAPDGRSLLISRAEANIYNDLVLLDLPTGESRYLTGDGHETVYTCVNWAPDSSALYLATNRDREFSGLARLDVASGELHWLAEPAGDVEAVGISPDGTRLAYVVNDASYSALHLRDLDSGAETTPDGLPKSTLQNAKGPASIEWSGDGGRLAFTVNGPDLNPNVWIWNTKNGSMTQVTDADTGGIPRSEFVSPRQVTFASFDRRQISGLLYTPVGLRPNGTNPVIVHVHGGPEGQDRPNFNAVYQYFVHRGYCVLAPNVRGSSGYGRTFIHLDDVRKRMDSVHDLKYAWEWLVDSGWGDRERIAVMGGSYGGFMVLAAITTYPELWSAAVEQYGIGDFLTFLENTSAYRRRLRAVEYGDPIKDADFLRDISPLGWVDRIRCPLMVQHGARDPRVPISESEQLVAALEAQGKTVEYVRFEDEGHGFVKRANRATAYVAIADFLERYL